MIDEYNSLDCKTSYVLLLLCVVRHQLFLNKTLVLLRAVPK